MILIGGTVFGFGANSEDQLGTTEPSVLPDHPELAGLPTVLSPIEIPGLSGSIVRIDCGSSFSVALDSDGNLLGWGSNDDGQLGLGEEIDSQKEPKGNWFSKGKPPPGQTLKLPLSIFLLKKKVAL